jgi:hypothetical protein
MLPAPDRVAAVRDCLDRHHRRALIAQIVPRPLAERPFVGLTVRLEVALEHELGVGGDEQVRRLGCDQPHRFTEERPGRLELAADPRQPRHRGQQQRGVVADRDRDRHALAAALIGLVDRPPVVTRAHQAADRLRAEDLMAVDAGVLHARVGMARHRDARRDVRPAVEFVVVGDRQPAEVDRGAAHDDVLHRCGVAGDDGRRDRRAQRLAVGSRNVGDAAAQRQGHALVGRHDVRNARKTRPLDGGEEQDRILRPRGELRGVGGDRERAVDRAPDRLHVAGCGRDRGAQERSQVRCHVVTSPNRSSRTGGRRSTARRPRRVRRRSARSPHGRRL